MAYEAPSIRVLGTVAELTEVVDGAISGTPTTEPPVVG